MTADRWTQIEPLFEAALDRPAGARADWLAAACPDPDLCREVAGLLAASEKATEFLETPAHVFAEDLGGAPGRIGPYRVLREIGRGGMGVVYLAARADGQYEQEVAVKVLRRSLDAGERHRRFLAERQILATLQHASIARLLDGGVTEDGRPYLVMEHVPGRPITDYCREHGLPLRQRLRLFASVCDAVQFAHRQLVVHRDLKPSNILVTDDGTDGKPSVKLLDFGIAKLLDPDVAGTKATRTGLYPMTPEYASPEQVRGEPVSTASDVYQLGLLLYELLTDRRPYRLHGSSRHDVERAILEQEPEPPSRAVGRAGKRALRGDLDRIVLKALRKEPERRYGSAEALARDIERHLAGLPVEARPATLAYRFSAFVRRHRAGVAAAVVVLVLGAASVVRVVAERDRAEAEAARAARVSSFLLDMLGRAEAPATDTGALLRLFEPAVARADSDFAGEPDVQAAVFYTLGRLYDRVGRPDQASALLGRALSLQRAAHPDPHEATAATLYALGQLQLSRPDSARALFEASAAMRRALHRGDHHDLAWSLLQGARMLPKGHPEKRAHYREALAMLERLHGPRSPEVADAIHEYHALGTADGTAEDYRAAFEEVLGIYTESGTETTPAALAAMYNLGLLYESGGDDARAFALFRRAIRTGRAVLPPGSPLLVTMMVNYGASLHEQGQFSEADSLLRDVTEFALRTLPDSASAIGHSHYWHGRNLLAMDRPAEAAEALRTAEAVYRRIQEDSPRHRRIQAVLAEALARRNRHAEAERNAEERTVAEVTFERPRE